MVVDGVVLDCDVFGVGFEQLVSSIAAAVATARRRVD